MSEAELEELPLDDCLTFLRGHEVGRVAVIVDDFPIVLPVNYRLLELSGRTWLVLRTRPGGVIDQTPANAAFEIDGIEPSMRRGWSVLVRGLLQRVDPEAAELRERFDPEPWMDTDRDAWLAIEPFTISGRRLHAAQPEWAFHPAAYL
jgi:nitroimidazol reductase NimA-like FMN-containing flavoprotein (pyridoxamine 5'-phosphate oxidase superfamily)